MYYLIQFVLLEEECVETYASVKGQIVIPVELRRKYGIKAGTKINIIDTGEAILLKPVTEETLRQLQGKLAGKGALQALLEERRADVQRE